VTAKEDSLFFFWRCDLGTPLRITVNRRVPLLSRILREPPHYALLFAMLGGFGLIAGSMLLKIDSFNTPQAISLADGKTITRQVGYIWAWNWSVSYAVLFPLSLYFGLLSLRCIRDSLREMHAQRMVRTAAMIAIEEPELENSWLGGDRVRRLLLWIFAFILPFTVSSYEWARNNLLRLFESPLAPATSVADYDWGLKALMFHAPVWARVTNAAFDLAAFCLEGLLLAGSLAYFLMLLDLGRVIPLTTGNAEPIRLIPNLKSQDRRAGFELFEEPLLQMLFVALVMFLMFYLVRIEGAYLHGAGSESNLAEFIQKDILAGASGQQGVLKSPDLASSVKANVAHLLDPGNMDVRDFLSQISVFLIFILCGIVIVMTVRIACQSAITNAKNYLDNCQSCTLFEGKHDDERGRLEQITSWPLGYIKPNLLFLAMAFAVASLYYYRIGLFVAGSVIATLLSRVLIRIQKWGQS
jgi:hypothetical protein